MGNKNGHYREFGRFRLDTERRVLWFENEPVNLPLKEIEVLSILTEKGGQVVTKDEILQRVWADSFVEESNLSRHIYLLRKTFKDHGVEDDLIQTVPRRGYRFVGEVNNNEQGGFVIERRVVTQTLIEQIEDSVEPNVRSSGATRTKRAIALSAAAIVVVASVFLYSRFANAIQPISSLAVLPFKTINASEDTHQGIGLADVLITRLSNIKQINVRPTNSIYEFENKEIDINEAAQKLGVDAILEGTIYYSCEKVRVTSRLSRVSDQKILWSGDFEQSIRDEMKIQNEIAIQVSDSLSINLSQGEKDTLSKTHTSNEDAFQLYLKGRYYWNKRNLEGLSQARGYFTKAIEHDPEFALAYIGLADTLLLTDDTEGVTNAYGKAIRIDPNLAEAYASMGFYSTFHLWNWDDAEENFKKAIRLKPGYVTAHQWYATFLMIRGRHTEAIAELNRALEINPNSYNILADLGQAYYFARDNESAERYDRQALGIYPDFMFAHENLAAVYFQTGNYEKALDERVNSLVAYSGSSLGYKQLTEGYNKDKQMFLAALTNGGTAAFWKAYLDYFAERHDMNPNIYLERAWIFTNLGQKEKALDSLETAVERHAFLAPFINVDPKYESLRSEPRFRSIVRKMNL